MLKKLEKSFFKGPKAKSVAVIILAIVVITSITLISMRKTIKINLNGEEKTLVTYKGTVKDVLKEEGIEVDSKDKVEPSLESKLLKQDVINLKKAVPIEIVANGTLVKIQSAEDTVEDMLKSEKETLKDQGIDFDKDLDEIKPSLHNKLEEGLSVQVIKVNVNEVAEKETIDFDTVVEKDSSLEKGDKKVKSKGTKGEKEIIYEVVYKDGQETNRKIKSSKIICEPKNEIVLEGTLASTPNRGSSGSQNSIKKTLSCKATAYSGSGNTCSGRQLSRNPNGISTIAVDPTVIPLGSKVYVDGYGYAIAADTGSSIKGNKIDVYFKSNSEACLWGLKTISVSIVAYPGEW